MPFRPLSSKHHTLFIEKLNHTDPVKSSLIRFAITIKFYMMSLEALSQTRCYVVQYAAPAQLCGRRRQSQMRSMTAHSRHPTCFYVGGRINS